MKKRVAVYTHEHPMVKSQSGDPARGEFKPRERDKPRKRRRRRR